MKHLNPTRLLATMLTATTLCGGLIGCRKDPAPPEETTTNLPDLTVEETAVGTAVETAVETAAETETSSGTSSELTLRDVYGDTIKALGSYADYGFGEVEATPLLDMSFDSDESLSALANLGEISGNGAVSNTNGAQLIAGRFGLRGALEFTALQRSSLQSSILSGFLSRRSLQVAHIPSICSFRYSFNALLYSALHVGQPMLFKFNSNSVIPNLLNNVFATEITSTSA